jgi:hypothetical protein
MANDNYKDIYNTIRLNEAKAKVEKVPYKDTNADAIRCFKDNTKAGMYDQFWAIPDPSVAHVWMVFAKLTKVKKNSFPLDVAVVYLKDDDLEFADDPEKTCKKYENKVSSSSFSKFIED